MNIFGYVVFLLVVLLLLVDELFQSHVFVKSRLVMSIMIELKFAFRIYIVN